MLLLALLYLLTNCLKTSNCECPNPPQLDENGFEFAKNKNWYSLLVNFMESLHSKKVPYDDLNNLIKYLNEHQCCDNLWQKVQPLFLNQIGFIVILVFGILFVLIVPITGICFCSLRLCNKCGAKKSHKNPKKSCRLVLTGGLAICFSLVLFGTVMFGISGQQLNGGIETAPDNLVKITHDLVDFATEKIEHFMCLVSDFTEIVNGFVKAFTALPVRLLDTFKLKGGLDDLYEITKIAKAVSTEITNTKQSDMLLEKKTRRFRRNFKIFFEDVKANFTIDYSKNIWEQLEKYSAEVNRSVTGELENVTEVNRQLEDVRLDDITKLSNEKLQKVITKITNIIEPQLEQTKSEVTNHIKEFKLKIIEIGQEITKPLNKFRKSTNNFREKFQKVLDEWNWVQVFVRIFIIFILCLILLLLVAGVVLGLICCKPYKRAGKCGFSKTGAKLLTGSVALMFMFSGLFMLVSSLIFLLAYPVQYVCEPVFFDDSLELYSTIDDIKIGDNFTLNIQKILRNCRDGRTTFSSWKIDEFINETFKDIENFKIAPASIAAQINIANLSYKLDCSTEESRLIKIAAEVQEEAQNLNNSVYRLTFIAPWNSITEILENITKILAGSQFEERALKQKRNFEHLKADYEQFLNVTLQRIATDMTQIGYHINETCMKRGKLERTISQLQKGVTQQTTNLSKDLLGNAKQWLNYIQTTADSCTTVYNLFQDFGTVGCKQLLYPIHGIWASLGLCALLFLPTIVLAVCLTKYQIEIEGGGEKLWKMWQKATIHVGARKLTVVIIN